MAGLRLTSFCYNCRLLLASAFRQRQPFRTLAKLPEDIVNPENQVSDQTDDKSNSINDSAGNGLSSDHTNTLDQRSHTLLQDIRAVFPYHAPWTLSDEDISQINSLPTIGKKLKTLNGLSVKEYLKLKYATKKASKRTKQLEEETVGDAWDEEKQQSKLFLWTRTCDRNMWYSNQLRHTFLYNHDIVLDCGFEKKFLKMSKLSLLYIEQFTKLYNYNRMRQEPAKIWLCNLAEDSPIREFVSKGGDFINPHNFLSMTTKSYLELFDRNKLVYLSGDSSYAMQRFDKDAVYIVGGLPDEGGEFVRETMAKAREENIKCLKLPLGKYVNFKGGSAVPINRIFMFLNQARSLPLADSISRMIPRKMVVEDLTDLRKQSAQAQVNQNRLMRDLRKS